MVKQDDSARRAALPPTFDIAAFEKRAAEIRKTTLDLRDQLSLLEAILAELRDARARRTNSLRDRLAEAKQRAANTA